MAEIDCSVAQTLSVIGEWWTLMILRNAFHGMRTFDAFREHLGISTSVLSDRLKTLTDAGIFRKAQSPTDGRSFEYRLTAKGMDLYPILVGMVQWGEKHMPSRRGSAGLSFRRRRRADRSPACLSYPRMVTHCERGTWNRSSDRGRTRRCES